MFILNTFLTILQFLRKLLFWLLFNKRQSLHNDTFFYNIANTACIYENVTVKAKQIVYYQISYIIQFLFELSFTDSYLFKCKFCEIFIKKLTESTFSVDINKLAM